MKRPFTGSNEQTKSNRTREATGDSSVVQNMFSLFQTVGQNKINRLKNTSNMQLSECIHL